jgi:flagellar motor switch/type III secretory pathway protein FliN
MNEARAFAWASLAALRRADVEATRRANRWVAARVQLGPFTRALEELLGVEVGARVVSASLAGPRVEEGDVAVVVAIGDEAERGLLVVEGALAAAVAARALRRPPVAVAKPAAPVAAAMAGALAAVVLAAARRAHAGVALRVEAAGGFEALGAEAARGVAAELAVVVGGEAFRARLHVPAGVEVGACEDGRWSAARLGAMGAVPLSLPVVACAAASSVADVASLAPGDVWIPGSWALEAGLRGTVRLAAPGAATGIRGTLVAPERFVLSGESDALCAMETGMSEASAAATLVDAVGDIPVVVRVEVGEVTMTAREWAALSPGDVVTLGRRAGEHVVLRAGGVPVARGELVTVDGEVGVRVVERFGGDVTRA